MEVAGSGSRQPSILVLESSGFMVLRFMVRLVRLLPGLGELLSESVVVRESGQMDWLLPAHIKNYSL